MGPKNFPSKAQPRENGLPYKGICVVPLLVTIIYNESLLPNIKQNICPKHDILSINVGYFQNRVFFFPKMATTVVKVHGKSSNQVMHSTLKNTRKYFLFLALS